MIDKILNELTLDEKVKLCSGQDFWTTEAVERLGLPSIMLTDGPHGLRKQVGETDGMGHYGSVKATCFPSGVTLAASWDKKLIEEVGATIATECLVEDVAVLLGPGANIKRSPLCGRNFEYFSEDPFLSGHMAKHHILGVQSMGVGTSLKHFAVNNQELKRMSVNANVDERTLREIYLTNFEIPIIEAKPWTVMCAYNRLNGIFCADHKRLLSDILRDEWGYEGLVVSDWGAVYDRVAGIKAGLDLEMPTSGGRHDQKVKDAISNGSLSMEELDKVVRRIIELAFKYEKKEATFDVEKHHKMAKKAASESMVLLKNNGLLPLTRDKKIAVIGELAQATRYQGGGSSHMNPTHISDGLSAIKSYQDTHYYKGYYLKDDTSDDQLVNEVIAHAKSYDALVIFAGLPERYESEGYDRKHLSIPFNQMELIQKLSEHNKNIVVVLANGSPIEMPWLGDVQAVLEGYLGGQASGEAIADILYGKVNPSGKLAETFPMKLGHSPSTTFPTQGQEVTYSEGIYVGYRYYDKKEIEPLFPFGYGLSYTNFEYSNLKVSQSGVEDGYDICVSVDVTNTGLVYGKEVVQLYVSDLSPKIHKALQELKGFEKVALEPKESKTVTFKLDKRSFAFYDVKVHDWRVTSGQYDIRVGGSSRDIQLSETINLSSSHEVIEMVNEHTTLDELMDHPKGKVMLKETLEKIAASFESGGLFDSEGAYEMAASFTLRTMTMFSGMTDEDLNDLVNDLNDTAE